MTDTRNDTQRSHLRYTPPKRSGKTPEAIVASACVKWLELLDFYVLRTGAGMVEIDGRKISVGRKGGHDYTMCAPNGRFVSMEVKSATGKPSEAQLKQRAYILRRNGVVTIPHSLDELQADMRRAFGDQTIEDWTTLGKARLAEKRRKK
jgi:hypothetical protein